MKFGRWLDLVKWILLDPTTGIIPHDIHSGKADPTIGSFDPGSEAGVDIFGLHYTEPCTS